MYVNNTRLSTAEDCLRNYFWRNEFLGTGISPKYIDTALTWGQIMHSGMAGYYDPGFGSLQKAESNIRKDIQLHIENEDFDVRNEWLDHRDWLLRIITEYDKWAETFDDFSVVQVECEGVVPIGEICYRCGWSYDWLGAQGESYGDNCPSCKSPVHYLVVRLDQIVNKAGALKVMDHKTAGSMSANYLESWDNSMQMIGYTYAARKLLDPDISGWGMNIIRKLKTIGLPQQTTKVCPECRNGKRKRLTCGNCNATGRVEKENNPSATPFVRAWYSYTDEKEERFVRSRLRVISDIENERNRFATEPDAAWPMNCSSCYKMKKCPFARLCYTGDPEFWYKPHDALLNLEYEDLEGYKQRGPDYVTQQEMIREEMK